MTRQTVSTHVVGLDDVLGKFAKLPAKTQQHLIDATEKSTVVLHEVATRYPRAMPRGRWARLATPAQKRLYRMSNPKPGPYKRSNTLGRRWRKRVYTSRSNVWGKVSNRTKYGKFVMGGSGKQWKVFAGLWRNTDQIAKEQERKITGFYNHAVEQATK